MATTSARSRHIIINRTRVSRRNAQRLSSGKSRAYVVSNVLVSTNTRNTYQSMNRGRKNLPNKRQGQGRWAGSY